MRSRILLALAAAAFAAPPAFAQTAPAQAAPATQMHQLGAETVGPADGPNAAERNRLRQPDQLTAPERRARPPAQIADAPRSAKPPPPLSKPGQGGVTGVARLSGKDRCTPQPQGAARPEGCERLIEERADEFEGPRAPELSPEQRILAASSDAPGDYDPAGAARELERGEARDSLTAQAAALSQAQAAQSSRAGRPDTPPPAGSVGLPQPDSMFIDLLSMDSR